MQWGAAIKRYHLMNEDTANGAEAYLRQSPVKKYTNMAKTQIYMKSQTNRAH